MTAVDYSDYLRKKKNQIHLTMDGRFLYFRPPVFPAHEVKEWGGRWDKEKKAWRLPRLVVLAERARDFDKDVNVSPEVQAFIDVYRQPWENVTNWKHPTWKRLYPYQRVAVDELIQRKDDLYNGTLLGLSPGLGKTVVSITAAEILGLRHVLVISPKSLMQNWIKECRMWGDKYAPEIMLRYGAEPAVTDEWVVTNYDTAISKSRIEAYTEARWDLVILDETVLLKNRKTQRFNGIKRIVAQVDAVWGLSGSPITHDNSDLWAQMNILEPEYFTSFWRFANEYCVVEQTAWATVIVGSRHGKIMRDELPEMMYVRNQDEVLPDLPDFIFKEIPITLTDKQQKAHDEIKTDWVHRLETGEEIKVTAVIAEIMRLVQVASNLINLETAGIKSIDNSAKADAIEDLIKAGDIEYPLLIWTHWRPGASALKTRLEKIDISGASEEQEGKHKLRVAHVWGQMKGNAGDTIQDYKDGKYDVLIMSLGVGKFGHTLTNTKTVIYCDKTWDSDAYFQSLHRVRRIGLEHKPVVISLRATGSGDDLVEANLAGKLPSMARVTGADIVRLLLSLGHEHLDGI